MKDVVEKIIVDQVKPEELTEAASVAMQALITNPVNTAVWQGYMQDSLNTMEKFAAGFMASPLATTFVAKLDNRIVGTVHMIEYPHCQLSPSQKEEMMPMLASMFNKDVLPRFIEWFSTWEKHDPQKPHWHIGPVGVLPELQGKGIGSKILAKCFEFIEQRGGSAYLETDKPENVRLYERFGFTVIEEADVVGVKNWFMWREPR